MNLFSRANLNHHIIVFAIIFLALSVGMVSVLLRGIVDPIFINPFTEPTSGPTKEEFEKSKTDEDFKAYVSETESYNMYPSFGGTSINQFRAEDSLEIQAPAGALSNIPQAGGFGGGADRVSQTNVQVKGIDEPDIVKTDGKHIYFSGQQYYYEEPFLDQRISIESDAILPPQKQKDPTSIIQAFPPETMEKLGSIIEQGNLLYVNDQLIVITYNKLISYNVSNPRIPVESWSLELDSQTNYHDARLYGDQLYLVTQTSTHRSIPCPMPLFTSNGLETSIRCTDIYHPVRPVPVSSTITISQINIRTGKIADKTSFVGSSGNSVVYMSPQSIYFTYTYRTDEIEFVYNFLREEEGLVPESVMDKINTLMSYDISSSSKFTEFGIIWESYLNSLNEDKRRKIENDFEDKLADYIIEHARELETTGIVKINRANLTIDSIGTVPGQPLNQFSMDEYQDHLRIATTTAGGFGWTTEGSVNDVYVLGPNMKQTGAITDLGLDERIYSARFIADKGYLVTFRQTDPFYILDLSDPNSPKMTGQLKIPGFSSYLHPISDDLILGVGQEGSKVKLAMFDVSNPNRPIEADKYIMDEYWTDVSNDHHAFLQDAKHEVFFIPAGKDGYIFSYNSSKTTGKLHGDIELEKAVATNQAKRALFLDDYLYIVGEQEIVVLDETTWERVSELSL